MKFKATMITPTMDGSGWLVRYFDDPGMEWPVNVTRHYFRWSARLAAWTFMRSNR